MSLRGKILKELEKRPRSLKELKAKLGNDKKVAKLVEELEGQKKIGRWKGLYAVRPAKGAAAVPCKLVKLGKSFGFAKPDDDSGDIFVPGRYLLGAMPGDSVLVELETHPRVADSREGRVTAVLEEHNDFTGLVQEVGGRLAVVPDTCPGTPLFLKKSADGGALPGEKAAVVILERGERHEDHRAGVAMRFGMADEARHCARAILYGAGLERHFPQKVKEEAKRFENAKVSAKELEGREDLRGWPIFTIDSAETKDIDDAVSIERTAYGYRLGVHIADVSYYVRPGTELDKEAFRRGTSVYYADSVVPMLPKALSNGICSLDAGTDRLAFSCLMELDRAGRVTDACLKKTVLRSRVKGVYKEINAILAGEASPELAEKYAEVAPQMPLLRELYEKLDALHTARGNVELESGEAKLILDEAGHCVDVQRRQRGLSEKMIEEFMLLANECVAGMARKAELPFVYRVHEEPEASRVDALQSLLRAAGVDARFESGTPTTLELAALLDKTRGTGVAHAVHTAVLRTMAKAKYAPVPAGHYGLALADYTHFTSPIRRYPDLAIHRILSAWLAGAEKEELEKRFGAFAEKASIQSSEREVAAMTAERDIEDCYKAEYLHSHLGENFDGIIAGVTNFGVYVELPNTCQGLVRADALSAGPLTLAEGMALRDAAAGKSWKLGDALRVKLAAADIASGNVDFVPADDKELKPEPAKTV